MHRISRWLTASAAFMGLLAAAPLVAAADEREPPDNDVGLVIYTKTASPGTLVARWNFKGLFFGPGLATGGPGQGFTGSYHVRYFNEDGTFSDEYDLEITPQGTFYDVVWRVAGKVKARGVGMLVEDGHTLAVGWHQVGS